MDVHTEYSYPSTKPDGFTIRMGYNTLKIKELATKDFKIDLNNSYAFVDKDFIQKLYSSLGKIL